MKLKGQHKPLERIGALVRFLFKANLLAEDLALFVMAHTFPVNVLIGGTPTTVRVSTRASSSLTT